MRRILIFSLVYYPRFIGGAEVAVKEITDRISLTDVSFDMVTMHTGGPRIEKIGNVNVYKVGPVWNGKGNSPIFFLLKYLFMPLALLKVIRLHRKNKYDVLWPIMASYASGPALFLKLFNPQTKLLLTLQEGDPFDHIRRRVGITYPFFKKLFSVADHVQAISQYLAKWARDMGAKKDSISVVPNGVDYEKFAKQITPQREEEIRNELGLRADDIVLVTSSRLVHKNAIDVVIDSLTYLPSSYKFLILGTGPLEQELRNQVGELKLKDRVIFKGFVDHKNLPEYLQASNIFIRPSRSEGMGISFIEAMAAGIPVIATQVGGIPDFLFNEVTGLFCEVDNPKDIAQKVKRISDDHELRKSIIDSAKDLTRAYDWEYIAKRMKVIFEWHPSFTQEDSSFI